MTELQEKQALYPRPQRRGFTAQNSVIFLALKDLPSGTGMTRFGQFLQTGGGGGESQAHAFSLITGKKQFMAHSLSQLGILPNGGHQTRWGVRSRAEQKVS